MNRWSAFALHLGLSVVAGGGFAALTRFVWYPGPLFEFSGAVGLLLILVPVDVVLGPLLTFVAFNPAKSRRALRTDLTIIGGLQVLALAYGVWTIAEVRPAYVVFVGDSLRIVRSIDVEPTAPWATPLAGPRWVAIKSRGAAEAEVTAVVAALKGQKVPLFDASNYLPFSTREQGFRAVLQPLTSLSSSSARALAADRAKAAGVEVAAVSVLPIMVRDEMMTALIHLDSLELLAILPGQVPERRLPAP